MAVTTRTRQPQHVTEPAVDTASPVDPAADAATAQRLTGVAYLRVSTKEQATRGGRAEGFSIPAQREAIHKLARDKGVTIIEEFVDAGESATSARRPELQRMLTFIKEHPVNICYVHKLDRLARNREDDVAINLVLRQYGVRLVSCTENIDQTASGELVHGIFAAISEFYSRNLSTEVTKGLRQKAINGGTINRAPLGYINIRQTDQNGREVRTVDVDPARAPLIAWAFEAYATGEWSLSDLCDELTLRGLTSLPTPKRPAKPIRINTLARMLHNPYYRGEIVYKGARHMGTHDPLVNDLVWLKVQDMLQAHNKAGDRTQVHDHYLKGSLHCECGSKMTVNLATNRHGETYPYFICLGRHTKQNGCRAHAVLVSTVERLVEEHYKTVEISPEASEALEGMIGEIFTRIDATSDQERTVLRKQAEKLEAEGLKIIQLFYDDSITSSQVKHEQERIEEKLQQIKSRLEAFEMGCKDAQIRIRAYLALATNCHDFYMCLDPASRRLCNQAFFTKIILTKDWVIKHTFEDVYDTIMQPEVRLHADYWQRTKQLHPSINLDAPLPPQLAEDRVGTSNIWWSIGDSNP